MSHQIHPNVIAFLGMNGSGKGKQSKLLQFIGGDEVFSRIEMSSVIREARRWDKDFSRKIDTIISSRRLVEDDDTISHLCSYIDFYGLDKFSWILDGFPRTPYQAEALVEMAMKMKGEANIALIHLHLSKDEARNRCYKRDRHDDHLEGIEEGFRQFDLHKDGIIVALEPYADIHTIEANQDPGKVFEQIVEKLNMKDYLLKARQLLCSETK